MKKARTRKKEIIGITISAWADTGLSVGVYRGETQYHPYGLGHRISIASARRARRAQDELARRAEATDGHPMP